MAFKKLNFKKMGQREMIQKSKDFLLESAKRRSVREFSNKKVPISIIKNAIKVAFKYLPTLPQYSRRSQQY